MKRYERLLLENDYLTGPKRTFVDIVVFMEIETIQIMFKRDLPSKCTRLQTWHKTLMKERVLHNINNEFFSVVQDWDLYAENHQ